MNRKILRIVDPVDKSSERVTKGRTSQDGGEKEWREKEKGGTGGEERRKEWERREQSEKGGRWRRRSVPPPTIIKGKR